MEQAVAGDAWIEHTSFVDDSSPITCIEYDHCYDLLWYGQANGRLTSYGFSDDVQYFDGSNPEASYYAAPPEMTRMTSLPVAADGIVQLLPNHSSLVAMSCSKIRMMSLNGAGIHTWNLNHCPSLNNFSMLSSAETAFTCADLIRDPTLPRFSSAFMATSLVAGTSTNTAYLFDLTQGVDSPVMMYNVSQPTVRIQSNGHVIVAAGQDGTLIPSFCSAPAQAPRSHGTYLLRVHRQSPAPGRQVPLPRRDPAHRSPHGLNHRRVHAGRRVFPDHLRHLQTRDQPVRSQEPLPRKSTGFCCSGGVAHNRWLPL
jgi:hypothetical protein